MNKRQAKKSRKLDGTQLGKMLNMDRKTIYTYINGDVPMNITTCIKLCAILRITPNYLLTGKE